MAKSVKKGREISKKRGKKRENAAKNQTKTAEYVSCLLELHKLQEVLLSQLEREVS